MKSNLNIKEVLAYLDKIGVTYTYENNPSPQEIERIKKLIAANEQKQREAIALYEKNKV